MTGTALIIAACSSCGCAVRMDKDALSAVCGRCMQVRLARSRAESRAARATWTPEDGKSWRSERGWTQEVMANKTKVPVSTIRSFEQGRLEVCPEGLAALYTEGA